MEVDFKVYLCKVNQNMFGKEQLMTTQIHIRIIKLEHLEQGGIGTGLDKEISGTN